MGYRWQMSLLCDCVGDTAGPQPRGRLSLLKGRKGRGASGTHILRNEFHWIKKYITQA